MTTRPHPMPPELPTGFGATTTAEEVADGLDLGGRTAVVTGASSGIGIETARVLAAHGAHVVLAVRDTAAGASVAEDIVAAHPAAHVEVRHLDLADRGTVDAFVQQWRGPLHVLIANAGVMALPARVLTGDGVEMQFAVNHLGHFQLATGLRGALVAADGARVVSVTSSGHQRCPVLFDDLDFSFVEYDPFLAYGQSKSANALFAVEADRRWSAAGVRVNAVMPGGIATGLQRHVDPEVLAAARRSAGAPADLKTPGQGAATTVLAAVHPALEGVGGLYLEDCGPAPLLGARSEADGRHGVAPFAVDAANARRLWEVSEDLLHLSTASASI
ncbi:SDR family NAD(P)-dependent oxidoreductase [Williamsia deligens]|uniref:SDR family NAD(P)-dependent oxidoreductase n=1 Tax=Williamsia deligens TaxID=321325 RepID=A0ABW3G9V9_9NOCA|nr:SDR family NAD(P)-dependent oxidoreductase [Williamsia deligens]MCP2192367.1 NAD(P)-dependent dehydrogenase, short-chain alcohol dehydrogenase family [Williamsia deligens]